MNGNKEMSTTLTKQPSETRIFAMSFANKLLTAAETISSINNIIIYPNDASLTVVEHSIGADKANLSVSSGDDNRTYKITVIVTTSTGQILENEGLLKVLDS